MEKVNWFEAYRNDDPETLQFQIIVPGELSPAALGRVLDLIFRNQVFFVGGSGDFESLDVDGDPA